MLDIIAGPEPNWHPVFVHFVVGLLLTATVALAVVAFAPQGWARRVSLQAAGDWMLAIGIAAALAAVAAGFQAYYTVAHDAPSHVAMTDHRNWALATTAVLLVIGVWRYRRRGQTPSILFVLAVIVAAGLLTATAWRGGELVFHHGLGVTSLPQSEGAGHDHDHGGGHAHDEESAAPSRKSSGDVHEHDDGHDHEHGGPPASAQGEGDVPMAPSSAADSTDFRPKAVVAAFHDALERKDEAAIHKLVLPDVVIFESGNAERSLAEYAGHHMPADMEFAASVSRTISDQRVIQNDDTAWVLTESASKGTFRNQPVHSRLMETMILKRMDEDWRIAHIHWSSSKIVETSDQEKEHDHADDHEH